MGVEHQSGGDDPRVGSTVAARYFLHRLLGRGGMGDVYEATRLADDRRVALKLLRAGPDEARLRRFEREAALAARLRHPGCVEVVESGRDPDAGHFLAMELVRGRDLARVLEDEGPLSPARAARVADGILAVLATAHAAGVVHRDLKPANVMLDEADGVERVKVLDFGIATFLDPVAGERPLTTDGVAHGTPAYMSPEQIRGEAVDARADLYAVGALLFEMLAGAPAFGAATPLAVAARQLTEDAPPLGARRGDVPAALAALVARALEREPARRPGSAEEMQEALRAAVPGLDAVAASGPRPAPATEAFPAIAAAAVGRRGWRWTWGAVGLGVVVAVGAVAVLRGPRSPSNPISPALSPAFSPAAKPLSTTPSPASNPLSPTLSPAAKGVRREGSSRSTTTPTSTPTSTPTATATPTATPIATANATPTAPAAPTAIRDVGGALGSIATPGGETGDGVLVLQAAPWAIVSVAGVALGETPREVRLAAGTYEVRGVHPELGERAQRVTVKPGARVLWSVSFER